MVDFEAVGKVADSCAAGVGVRDYNYFMPSVDEFLGRFQSISMSLFYNCQKVRRTLES